MSKQTFYVDDNQQETNLVRKNPLQTSNIELRATCSKIENFCNPGNLLHEKWLYTRNQTAIIFSVSLVCLWHWRNRNILVPIKCGGKVYYTRNSILELINQNNI